MNDVKYNSTPRGSRVLTSLLPTIFFKMINKILISNHQDFEALYSCFFKIAYLMMERLKAPVMPEGRSKRSFR